MEVGGVNRRGIMRNFVHKYHSNYISYILIVVDLLG